MKEEETTYETIMISTCDIVKRCSKCYRVRILYNEEKDFNFCDKCGRRVVNNIPYQHYYPQSFFNDCLDVNDEED